MPRLRFSRPGSQQGITNSPFGDEPRGADDVHYQQTAPAPAITSVATASREERELIEQVQMRLLSEPEPLGARQDPDYFLRRIAAIVAEQLEQTGRVISDRERARLTRLAQSELLGLGPLEELLA